MVAGEVDELSIELEDRAEVRVAESPGILGDHVEHWLDVSR
jgi:hypothetical protein